MKKYIVPIMVAILLLSGVFYLLQHKDTAEGTEIIWNVDITDIDSNHILASQLLAPIMDKNMYEPISVHIQAISDYRNNPVQNFQLQEMGIASKNAHRRKRQINTFSVEIDSALDELYTQQTNKGQSFVFEPIINALNELALSTSKRKICLIQSDLCINTPAWSIYRKENLQLLLQYPDSAEHLLTRDFPLSNLSGIEIYCLHTSRNQQDDYYYTAMYDFMKTLFEKKGAKIFNHL